jgi:putative DNA-invertase from lambdoid prophage Rac
MRLAYLRVSTSEQSTDSQIHALGGGFDDHYQDQGVSGAVLAADRPGFAKMVAFIDAYLSSQKRKAKPDTVEIHVTAVDRLGRDAIDVQTTVRDLMAKGVSVHILGLGVIAQGAGELILAVLAQVAQMERNRTNARAEAGRAAARESLALTGLTHRGKKGLGRQVKADPATVAKWRTDNSASQSATAAHWGLSLATVKRYCAGAA